MRTMEAVSSSSSVSTIPVGLSSCSIARFADLSTSRIPSTRVILRILCFNKVDWSVVYMWLWLWDSICRLLSRR